VCVGDQPELDFGGKRNPNWQKIVAWGWEVKGMDVCPMRVTPIAVEPATGFQGEE
jgi:hypothetical protein